LPRVRKAGEVGIMRLIDADALLKELTKAKREVNCHLPDIVKLFKGLRDWIKEAPTLDAVPVIRCPKCKYYGPGDHAGFWRCENWGVDINSQASPPETFYCADGEQKEEET